MGLSITTVSRALNGHSDVAPATRARVEEAARDLDYHPNMFARSLQTSRADAIALIIPHVLHRSFDTFWLDFIAGVEAACTRKGVDLLLTATDDEVTPSFRRVARGRRVDGVLLCDVRRTDPRVAYLSALARPFVCFGRTTDDHDYAYIDVDGASGVCTAVEHLLGLGHRRIAYLGVDPDFGFSHFRLHGYQQALSGQHVPLDPDLVRESLTEFNAVAVIREMLSLSSPPTAIFATADFLGVAAVKTARELGLRIPDELSLCVFDDSPLVRHLDPPLTVVSQSNRRLGEEAARLLLDRVGNPAAPVIQRLVVPALVIRQSTGPVNDDRVAEG